ncbi:hypothetical protein [uncultured Staphylococcus sp.]|nr:hypothetical protein [uncultured Staphylococcus sp.]
MWLIILLIFETILLIGFIVQNHKLKMVINAFDFIEMLEKEYEKIEKGES